MFVEYDSLKLAKIFDFSKKLDRKNAIEYRLNVSDGITFLLHLFPSEKQASIMLLGRLWEGPVFEVLINNLDKISSFDHSIVFYNQSKRSQAFSVTIKPSIILNCSDLSRVSFISKRMLDGREIFSAYQDQEILELFGTIRFTNEDNTIVDYRMLLEDGKVLKLGVLKYDELAFLTLMRENEEDWLFDVKIEHLYKIERDKDMLKFYKNENQNIPALTLLVRPRISMQCDVAAPKNKN